MDEEEPSTPEPYSEGEILVHPVFEEWNALPIAHWKEHIGTVSTPEGESYPFIRSSM